MFTCQTFEVKKLYTVKNFFSHHVNYAADENYEIFRELSCNHTNEVFFSPI